MPRTAGDAPLRRGSNEATLGEHDAGTEDRAETGVVGGGSLRKEQAMQYEVGLRLEFRWLLYQQQYGRTARITGVEGLLYDLETANGTKLRWAAYEITRALKPIDLPIIKKIRGFSRRPGVGRRVMKIGSPVLGVVVHLNALDVVTVQWADDTRTVENIAKLVSG